MNKIRLCFLLMYFLTVCTFETYSQKCSIKGFVYDSETQEPIEYANVRLSNTPMGSSTDADGAYFIISIDPGNYIIEVFRIGFDTIFQEVNISPGEMKIYNFTLEGRTYQLSDVQITGNRSNNQREINISKIKATSLEIEKIPSIGSIPDITQYLQTLPGVVSNGDIGGQLYVRGGAPIHNKILMDGAIIYNPLHSIGLFSVFDVDIIRSLDVYTGGFGSQYGGSISSIMDITTRMGNINRFSGKVDISTLGGKILLEGPIMKPGKQNKGHSSYLVSYKTSNFSQASRLFYPYLDSNLPFSFSDLFLKTSITTSNVFKANIFGFYSTDNVGVSESIAEFNWKSYGFGGSLILSPPNSASLLKAYFATSSYKLKLEEHNYVPRKSEIGSFNMGLNVNFYFEENYLKYGMDIVTLNTDYFYYSTSFNSFSELNYSSELSGYVLYHGSISNFIFEPSIRLQWYTSLSLVTLEPRISAKYKITTSARVKVAAGMYSQNLMSAASDRDIINYFRGYLSAPVGLVNEDKYNNGHAIQKSIHFILGGDFDIGNNFLLNIEAYFKKYPQLINFNRNKLFNEFDFPEQSEYLTKDFILEKGYSKGIEFTGRYQTNNLIVNAAYSYAITEREYENDLGEWISYYPHYDRRHNVNIFFSYEFGKDKAWEFNSRWNLGSGFPYTQTQGYFENVVLDQNQISNYLTYNGDLSLLYGQYNSGRLPVYHRLDMSLKRQFEISNKSKLEIEVSVINVYNQKNIYYVDRLTNSTVYQLPILPGLHVSYRF